MYYMSVPPGHSCEWGLLSTIRNDDVGLIIVNVLALLDSTAV